MGNMMPGGAAPLPPEMPPELMPPGAMPPAGPEMGMDPGAMPPPQFPSTDPSVIAQVIAMIGQLQQEDHMNLQAQQDGVLQMLLQSIVPQEEGIEGMATPMGDAGFAEGAEAPMVGPDQMMM